MKDHVFYQFCDNCKILSCTFYLKEDEMKIAMFAQFKEYHGNHKKSFKLLKFFMISVILFKLSKHSDFHLIFFQIEGA